METIFGVRRRARRLMRAGLESLRDVVDERLRRIDEKRRAVAKETPASPEEAPAPRRRGRPRKVTVQ